MSSGGDYVLTKEERERNHQECCTRKKENSQLCVYLALTHTMNCCILGENNREGKL